MSEERDDGIELKPIEENDDEPVTRGEFNDAMRDVANSFAGVESNFAEIRAEMATKDDLRELESRMNARFATKDELAAMEQRLTNRMDARAEATIKAITRHVDVAIDHALQQHVKPLDERISRLEEISGLSRSA